jgi:uncharacterized membrane protein YfcA
VFHPEWLLAYLALGACTGFLAGLFGIGGGLLLVPALFFLFHAQHLPAAHLLHLALGTAMATILFTSLSSLYKHHQHGAVYWKVVRDIAPGILLGTGIGVWCATSIPTLLLSLFFALFVCFAALQILLDVQPHPSRQLPGTGGMTLMGIITGWVSSLVSIGGGTLIIPFQVWCNVPLRNAIGTSAAIGFPIALGGTVGYILSGLPDTTLPPYSLGFVYLPALCWVALASMLTAPLGAKATHRMNISLLRKLFAILLIVLAAKMLLQAIN